MATDYKKLRYPNNTVEGQPIKVDAANEDGEGKNIVDTYAEQSGVYYEGMGVGFASLAKNIESDRAIEDAEVACPPIIFGSVGGSAEVADGYSNFEYLEGNSKKWNQLVNGTNNVKQIAYTGDPSIYGSVTFDSETHIHSYTFGTSVASTVYGSGFIFTNVLTTGHKYFISLQLNPLKTGNWYFQRYSTLNKSYTANTWNDISIITTGTGNNFGYFSPNTPSSQGYQPGDVIQVRNFICLDLTEIFGAGNEPTTVAEVRAKYPLDYYPYDGGSIISSKVTSLISVGKNQFSGLNEFIRVLPNTEYELSGITAGGYIEEYDANYTLIQTSTEITGTTDITLTENTCYVKIQAITYGNIMFYITYETYNEPYEAYSKQIIELPNIELRSVGDVRDIAYQQGGGLRKIGVRPYESGDENDDSVLTDGTVTQYVLVTPTEISYSENPGWIENVKIDNFGTLQFTPSVIPQVEQYYFIKYTVNLVEFIDSAYVRTGGDANNIALQSDMNKVEQDIEDIKTGAQPAGLSENLKSEMVLPENSPYLFRTTGGALEVADNCYEKSIVGGSIVVNQYVQNGNFTNSQNWSAAGSCTFAVSNNIATITSTSDGATRKRIYQGIGGKGIILKKATVRSSTVPYIQFSNSGVGHTISSDWTDCYEIVSYSAGLILSIEYSGASFVTGATIEVKNVQVINLTQMFGSTIANYIYSLETNSAGAGVAWVKQFLPKDYYPYVATPYFLNVKTTGKKVVGFNAYNHTAGTARLLGGNEYQITGTYTSVSYVDINGDSETLTIDTDGKFTPVKDGVLTVVDGNETDTCVHLVWDGERDGQFEPYKSITYPYDDVELRGMVKLDSNNNFYYDGDIYKPDGTVVRNYAIDTVANIPQFNQFAQKLTYWQTRNCQVVDLTTEATQTITITATAPSSSAFCNTEIKGDDSIVVGHKVFVIVKFNASTNFTSIRYKLYKYNIDKYINVSQGNSVFRYLGTKTNAQYNLHSVEFTKPSELVANDTLQVTTSIIDLTMLYGAGNEPTTVGDCSDVFPNDFYTYKVATVNTDGATKYDYLTVDYTNYLYKLSTTTTETADASTEKQQVDNWGTEEFIDTRTIPLLVGHNTEYLPDLKAKVEVAPESPETDGYYVLKRENEENSYFSLSSWLTNNGYKKDLTQSTDLTPTTQTLTLSANTRYALGTLTALDITFPSTGNEGDEIVIGFISGSTATTLTLDNVNAIYNFDSASSNVFIELNAQYKASVSKWVVYSAETAYGA